MSDSAVPNPHGAETDAIYDRAGFGSPVRRGERPAIVVVDLTKGFTDPGYLTGADLTDVVTATARLVEAAHLTGVPVVYTTIGYTPAELRTLLWLDKAPGLRALAADSEAVEVDDRLPFTDADHLIIKSRSPLDFKSVINKCYMERNWSGTAKDSVIKRQGVIGSRLLFVTPSNADELGATRRNAVQRGGTRRIWPQHSATRRNARQVGSLGRTSTRR